MKETLIEDLEEATPVLQEFIGNDKPAIAMVLGSGLNAFADRLEDARVLSYGDVPHMSRSTAIGHKGCFVLGTEPVSGVRVLCMQGRLHAYEGNTSHQVAFPIWLMNRCGITSVLTTNAAGAINPTFGVGEFCLMEDQINFTGRNPLVGVQPDKMASRFIPMKDAFDKDLSALMLQAASTSGIKVHTGVYIGLLGPSFETAAEIRAFASWGADTVAMSVVEEVIAARHSKMRVIGMSMISNMATGVEGGNPVSEDIMEVMGHGEEDFNTLMQSFLKLL